MVFSQCANYCQPPGPFFLVRSRKWTRHLNPHETYKLSDLAWTIECMLQYYDVYYNIFISLSILYVYLYQSILASASCAQLRAKNGVFWSGHKIHTRFLACEIHLYTFFRFRLVHQLQIGQPLSKPMTPQVV